MFGKSVLPNGLRVLTSHIPHTRSVSIGFFIAAGSRYETDEQGGAFHFVEHLLFKGTERRPTPQEISETIERVGGIMNGSTDREVTAYWAKVPGFHFPTTVDLFADLLRNSRFDAEEMEKERGVILEELAMTNDHPDDRVGALIDLVLWPDQPLGRDAGGTPDSVRALTRDTLLDCMAHQYVPSNTVVAVAGEVTHAQVTDLLTQHMGEWEAGEPRDWFPARNGQTGPQVRVEWRRTDQAHVCLALRGLSSTHPQRYTMDLLNSILGEGMSSRLFLELRERRGLVYSAFSAASHFKDAGALIVYFALHPKNAASALEAAMEELRKLARTAPEEELAKVKEMIKGRLLLRMEDTRSVAFWGGSQEILLDRVLTVDEIAAKIDAIDAEEVRQLAETLLTPENLNLAVVGPFRSSARFERVLR